MFSAICATWLQLPDHLLHHLLGYLYEGVSSLSPAVEAEYLALLVNPDYPGWSREQA